VWEWLRDLLDATAQQYGIGVVLVILFICGLLWMLHRSYMARLNDKDAEIQRLADANKEMLTKVLKRPISSTVSKRGKRE